MAWEKEKKPAFNSAKLLSKYCKNFNQTGNVQSDNGIFVSQNALHSFPECKNVLHSWDNRRQPQGPAPDPDPGNYDPFKCQCVVETYTTAHSRLPENVEIARGTEGRLA